jgi:fumarate hydratase subunit alpha/L(+)-tartrate dehydratase alpha subunit
MPLTPRATHAATHATMNPVAVNLQCHSARRARATFIPSDVEYGFF